MYWENTAGNVHLTQVALKLLCSHTEMESTASVLLQKHHLCSMCAAKGCDPLQLNKQTPTNIFPIKKLAISDKISGIIKPLY